MKYSFPNRWLSYTTFHIHNKIEYKNQERRICLFIILRQPLLKQKTTKGGQEAASVFSVFSLFSIISLEASSIASVREAFKIKKTVKFGNCSQIVGDPPTLAYFSLEHETAGPKRFGPALSAYPSFKQKCLELDQSA